MHSSLKTASLDLDLSSGMSTGRLSAREENINQSESLELGRMNTLAYLFDSFSLI